MKYLLLTLPIILGSCLGGATRSERLEAIEYEAGDAAITLRELAAIYQGSRPDLAMRLGELAVGLESVAQAVAAVREGGLDPATPLEAVHVLLAMTAAHWSEDADVQAGVALARAGLRRAERELAR
jgi:hypothetical protein